MIQRFFSKLFVLSIILYSVTACKHDSMPVDANMSAFAEEIHLKIKQKKFSEIYDDAAPEFKNQIEKQNFLKSMEKIDSILGTPLETKLIGEINTVSLNNKPLIAAQFSTAYQKGSAIETIHVQKKGDKLILFQYNINSDDLIKKLMTE